jgi:hypothetical protein
MNAEQQATDTAKAVRPINREPYQQAYYPPVPTGFTKHMRTNPLWQLWRFIVINWKIGRLMLSSHRSGNPA